MSELLQENCFPSSRPWFSTLGDLDRAGREFSASPQNVAVKEKIQRYRAFRMLCLTTTVHTVEGLMAGYSFPVMVSVRIKRLNSIRRKILRPEADFALGRMDDIVGVRIICPSYAIARTLSERVSVAPDVKTKDYINGQHPKSTGYRSMHHILRFPQFLSKNESVDVRFEIQIRSYLQHRWALWSEAKGEEIKAGHVSEKIKDELLTMSEKIAKWEESHPEQTQREIFNLFPYEGTKNFIVAKRLEGIGPLIERFQTPEDAIEYLNHHEMLYPKDMNDMLLLVGVTTPERALAVLRETHPLYTQSRVISPEFYMPE